MIQWFKKLTAVMVLALMLSANSVMASGKMELDIGDRVDFASDVTRLGLSYKWVVTLGDEILATQETPNFNVAFTRQGEHEVNLTATDKENNVYTTTIKVLVGGRYSTPDAPVAEGQEPLAPGEEPLFMVLETLPEADDQGRVNLVGEGQVRYDLSLSTGNIIEYRIDKNIFVDSDGNGTANDDIDNQDDASYLTGSPFLASYEAGESPQVVAEITLIDSDGKKVKEQVEVSFEEVDRTGDPVAVLDVSPAPDEENVVRLYENPHKVAFYSKRSRGSLMEYRIDTNIFMDSDGDGDPANDIDNRDHPSFKNGDLFEVEYGATDDQIIAQLIVVGDGGKGSRIQRQLVFGDRPVVVVPLPEPTEPTEIALTADKDIVRLGDPMTFSVVGLQQALDQYIFEWDFDGDEQIDKEVEGLNKVEHIYEAPGVFEAAVTISDQDGNSAVKTLQITSRDRIDTVAAFDFEVEGNTVNFEDKSTASDSLSDSALTYEWSFGDTDETSYEEQKNQIGAQNPVYRYPSAGTYIVTLRVIDASDVISETSSEVEITEVAAPVIEPDEPSAFEPTTTEPQPEGGSSIFVSLLKFALYLVLIVITLILVIVGGFLGFLKVQHPDLTFEELVDELKAKILTMMGVHEGMEHKPADMAAPQPPKPEAPMPPKPEPAKPAEPAPAPTPQPDVPVEPITPEPAPTPAPTGPTPDWLKGKEVIEGEVEEEVPAPAPQSSAEPAPVPEAPVPETPAPPAPEAPKTDEQPPEPPAPSGGPMPESPKPDEPKGPVPDWLKNA